MGDCSGLVQYAHAQAGIVIPRTTGQQFSASDKPAELRIGDPIPTEGVESASLSQEMQSGIPIDVSGSMVHVSGTCRTDISFDGETILSLLGTYPNLTADIDVRKDTDVVLGRVFFNGTNMAVLEISLNGTGPFQFDLDLDTGAISPSP